ncbi:hypothetical protein C8R47DRAFT_1092327 [Mycena vitilis]|nr:hypothetical protein C8R47DRAFT_1092327 [Mycena vitilis]
MSQVKLTLRPPPNVDFVHGYPGIPPGPDRPQAAVKGAIEVRVGPQGAKAKWVRIELRKVETLPGGGVVNTFHDFVGPSPVNLWSASEEYGLLRSQDFPFSIRIPESIPPSIDLQNRAGINYELLASVCTKGKKGFLRKRKSVVVSTQADILIDKHELHSTWPVYCQPETRNIAQEGVTLIVERSATCYGPGDRVSLFATVKSDALHTVILRGFELTLKESTIFRAGPYTSGKKSAPQVRVLTISENKFPVNATLYGGTQHRTELTCMISPDHTTTTLNAARHIDITYTLSVKALMGTGTPLIMDLPVIVSNWQRAVSAEAIRRIGPAPSLSLLPTNPARRVEDTQPQTFAGRDPVVNRTVAANVYNTMPVSQPSNLGTVDEFGGYTSKPTHRTTNSRSSGEEPAGSTARPGAARRPGSADRNRFTITNAEIPEEEPAVQRQAHETAPRNTASRNKWPTAEEEKQRLYEEARAKVERTQGIAARGASPPPVRSMTPPRAAAPHAQQTKRWPTAEEEKLRLFNEAQEAVKRTQGMEFYSGPSRSGSYQASTHGRSNSDVANDSGSSKPMAAVAGGSSPSRSDFGQKPTPKMPQYMTADQEKAALRRYHEAKQAVGRVQGYVSDEGSDMKSASGSSPIAYDSLFPSPSGSSTNAPNGKGDSPPPFDAASPDLSRLPEKERLRRAYAAQDAAALQNNRPANDAPPPFSGGSPQGLSEKEMLQRKFDAQDAESRRAAGAPRPPPRKESSSSIGRPTPPPPGPVKILTALEEKALLKARYDAEDAGSKPKINGNGNAVYTNGAGLSSPSSSASAPSTPPVPPPLKPRPPVEYIQETQEEDARVSRFVTAGVGSLEDTPLPTTSLAPSRSLLAKPTTFPGPDLDAASFTPAPGFDAKLPGPPPPLPPKPAE